MKRLLRIFLLTAVFFALLAVPAHALEYTIGAPDDYLFGQPTSDDTVYQWENPNVDRSRNIALIAPGFGTPTSYLPGSGEYLTPNLVPGSLGLPSKPSEAGSMGKGGARERTQFSPQAETECNGLCDDAGGLINQAGSVGNPNGGTSVNTTGGGYPATSIPTVDNSGYPTVDTSVSGSGGPAIAFTEVTGSMYYSNGSLGTLKIPSIGLTVGVYEGTGSAPLLKGAGHFEGTSIWQGNVCIAGHNRGVRNDFGKIHTLQSRATITLTTTLGTRTYAVSSVTKVAVTDTSGLEATPNNQITLYTCVENQPDYRWCVKAMGI